jgi:hypothetical protein
LSSLAEIWGIDLADGTIIAIETTDVTTSLSGTGMSEEIGYRLSSSNDISGTGNTYSGGGDACPDVDGNSLLITLEVDSTCPRPQGGSQATH